MAITATALTSGTDTENDSAVDTASITPSGNELILLTVASKTSISTDPNQPTASGNGLTWVVVASVVYDTTSSTRRRVTVFRAMGASPSTGAITIDFGGQSQISRAWAVEEYDGVDTGGTNGSAAVVQSATNSSGAAQTLTVTLGAFSSSGNATFGTFAVGGSDGKSAGTGYTETSNVQEATQGVGVITQFRNDNDTSVNSGTLNSINTEVGGVGVEIAAAPANTRSNSLLTLGVG